MVVAVGVMVMHDSSAQQSQLEGSPTVFPLDPEGVTLKCYRTVMFSLSLILSQRIARGYDRWCARGAVVGR